jgi:hypothetical protein
MGELSDFERGQIDFARLAKATTSLVVLRAAVSKIMTAYKNHGKTSAKRNSGRKPKLSERDLHTLKRIMSKNH